MNRVLAVAACALALAGCESLQTLQLPSFSRGPEPVTLTLESDPPGAEAKLSTGGNCTTPCALPVPATGDVTVNFSLNNYQGRAVTARAVPAEKNFIGMESGAARFEPNPVFVELQAIPQKKRPARRPTAKKPAAAQTGQASAPAARTPAAGAATPAPAAPWPASQQ
jgi:hypothetical protein